MDIRTEVENFLGEKRALVDAIVRELRAGTPANAIAREVAPAFSRDQVKEFAAAITLQDSARKALNEAGLGNAADVRATGMEPPREVRLNLAADPGEPGYDKLPDRIREAFLGFHITMEPVPGRHGDETVDDLLRDGEPVRLARQKPRT